MRGSGPNRFLLATKKAAPKTVARTTPQGPIIRSIVRSEAAAGRSPPTTDDKVAPYPSDMGRSR